jgi:hypothetical protein
LPRISCSVCWRVCAGCSALWPGANRIIAEAVKRRPDLKIIVTSATLDAEKFAKYFYGCPIFTIPGRTFPVEILYTKEPESDYLDASLITIMQIHLSEPPGDILLFLTGQEEIDTACEVLYERMKALGPQVPDLLILPIYSALPSEMQSRIFDPAPPGTRKVVIATNIAETSVTIDGIYYVIDPGFSKQNAYDPKLGMDSLVVVVSDGAFHRLVYILIRLCSQSPKRKPNSEPVEPAELVQENVTDSIPKSLSVTKCCRPRFRRSKDKTCPRPSWR